MGRVKDYYFEEIERMYNAVSADEEEYDEAFSELDREELIPNPTFEELDAIWVEYETSVLNCDSCDGEGCRKCRK